MNEHTEEQFDPVLFQTELDIVFERHKVSSYGMAYISPDNVVGRLGCIRSTTDKFLILGGITTLSQRIASGLNNEAYHP